MPRLSKRVSSVVFLMILLVANCVAAHMNDAEQKKTDLSSEEAHLCEQELLATNAHRTTYTGPSNPEILWRTDIWEKHEILTKSSSRLLTIQMNLDPDKDEKIQEMVRDYLSNSWRFEEICSGYNNAVIIAAKRGFENDCRITKIDANGHVELDTGNMADRLANPIIVNSLSPVFICETSNVETSIDIDSNHQQEGNIAQQDFTHIAITDSDFTDFDFLAKRNSRLGIMGLVYDGDVIRMCNTVEREDLLFDTYLLTLDTDGSNLKEYKVQSSPDESWGMFSWWPHLLSVNGVSLLSYKTHIAAVSSELETNWVINTEYRYPMGNDVCLMSLASGDFVVTALDKAVDITGTDVKRIYLEFVSEDGSTRKRISPLVGSIQGTALTKDNTVVALYHNYTYPPLKESKERETKIRKWNKVEAYLAAFSLEGEIRWSRKLSNRFYDPRQFWLDDAGNMYYTVDGSLISLDKMGNERWRIDHDDLYVSDFCFASNGNMYLAGNGEVICIGDR